MHLFTGDYCRARGLVLMEFVIVAFDETVSSFQFWLESEKNNAHFTWKRWLLSALTSN